MSSPLSTAMFIVYNIESIPSNVSRVVSTKYLHCGEKKCSALYKCVCMEVSLSVSMYYCLG